MGCGEGGVGHDGEWMGGEEEGGERGGRGRGREGPAIAGAAWSHGRRKWRGGTEWRGRRGRTGSGGREGREGWGRGSASASGQTSPRVGGVGVQRRGEEERRSYDEGQKGRDE